MIIRSGVADEGTYGLVNFAFIAETTVAPKPQYAFLQKFSGDYVVKLWYANLENDTVIFSGTKEECQQQVDAIFGAYHLEARTYFVPMSATIDD